MSLTSSRFCAQLCSLLFSNTVSLWHATLWNNWKAPRYHWILHGIMWKADSIDKSLEFIFSHMHIIHSDLLTPIFCYFISWVTLDLPLKYCWRDGKNRGAVMLNSRRSGTQKLGSRFGRPSISIHSLEKEPQKTAFCA